RLLRRPIPVLELRPGLLEHPQLHPAGRHVLGEDRHLQRDPLRRPDVHRADRAGQARARPGAAQAAPARRAGDRVQHRGLHHLGLQAPARRLFQPGAGPRTAPLPAVLELPVLPRVLCEAAVTDLVTTDQAITTTPVSAPSRRGSAWLNWFARRLGLAVLTLWLCSVLVFFATAA